MTFDGKDIKRRSTALTTEKLTVFVMVSQHGAEIQHTTALFHPIEDRQVAVMVAVESLEDLCVQDFRRNGRKKIKVEESGPSCSKNIKNI